MIDKEKKYNYEYIDLMKFIMSIIVIIIHVFSFKLQSSSFGKIVIDKLNLLPVPFFFTIFGYFFYSKYKYLTRQEKIDYIRRKLNKFIKIYIIWNIIYLPIIIYISINNGYGLFSNLINIIKCYFFTGDNFFSYHLWFLLSLIYSLYFLLLLEENKVKKNNTIILSVFITIVGFLISYIANISSSNSIILFIQDEIRETVVSGRIFYGLGFIALGRIIASKNIIKRNRKIYLLNALLLLVIIIFSNEIISNLLNMMFIFNFIKYCLTSNIKVSNSYLLRTLSKVTYYTHMIFFFLYVIFTIKSPYNSLKCFIIVFIITELFGYLVYKYKTNNLLKKTYSKLD